MIYFENLIADRNLEVNKQNISKFYSGQGSYFVQGSYQSLNVTRKWLIFSQPIFFELI